MTQPATFPPFSGNPSTTPCPKCGHAEVSTYWVPSTADLNDDRSVRWGAFPDADAMPGWLHRWCDRCSFAWGEAALDAGQ